MCKIYVCVMLFKPVQLQFRMDKKKTILDSLVQYSTADFKVTNNQF